ncbi:MAG: HAMP domain-containing protein [Vitreoscilla sp.]|nr:HAMP domain-containing protein [Vitreoscilla sp.]
MLNSLPRKLMLAISVWLLGALFCVGITLNITWRLEDRGIAINEAGSLRKQSYLMLAMVQAQQTQTLPQEISVFEKKLANLADLKKRPLILGTQNLQPLQAVQNGFTPFKNKILAAAQTSQTSPQLLTDTRTFIASIDNLVKSIETENTHSIKIMRMAQGILMLMAIVSAMLSVLLLNRLVIRPLSKLNQGIQKISDGHLDTRVHIPTHDEFNQVSEGFNHMVQRLQDAYQHLEDKVKQKTVDLARTNQELSTLYEMTAFLHKAPSNKDTMTVFLQKVMQLTGAPSGSIRLLNQEGEHMDMTAHINVPPALLANADCTDAHACLCGDALFEPDFVIYPMESADPQLLCHKLQLDHLTVYQIQLREQTLGLLTLYYDRNQTDPHQELPIITLLCSQLAVSIENNRLSLRETQFAVVEERNIMAQGLHDSIAQSLSFLNLQLQMLETALAKNNGSKIAQHMAFLNTGVQQCYDDVRELLSNFRLKMALASFQEILNSVIERFKMQTPIDVKLQYASAGQDLSPQQQLQLVFIVQEALSNIRKHAKASQVLIDFSHQKDHINLLIRDNGVGFDTAVNKEHHGHHIGLSIMQERIAQIQGDIAIESAPNHGTSIHVSIHPQ